MHNFERIILKVRSSVVNTKWRLLFVRKFETNVTMENQTDLNKRVWDPSRIFRYSDHDKYAVIILNSPLHWKRDVLLRIWKNAQVKVTVDGGTTRWFQYLKEQNVDLLTNKNSEYIPNLITGDMDSCSSSILEKFRSMGSMVVETPDQDYTDYSKALSQLHQYAKDKNKNLDGVYVFVDASGRFDHILGNINTLYESEKLIGVDQVIQIASNSLTWLLKPGFHSIIIPSNLVENNCWCGILPIGGPANRVTTTGLKWNLSNSTLQFGGLISTSNTYDNCSEVTVNTDSPVIWTMGIEPFNKSINLTEDES